MAFLSRCFRLLRRYAKYLVKNEMARDGESLGMQEYIERQMTELHYTAVSSHFCQKFIAFLITAVCAVLLPYLHIGVLYMMVWVPDKPPVDRYGCTCSCFDTVFRGRYENPGVVTYKHVYFNATSVTLKVWVFTAVFLMLFYESVRYLVGLVTSGLPLRGSMLFLYLANLYPHYYSWWSFFSYYNEELYTYFTHHLMFTVTEMLVTGVVLNLCRADSAFSAWKLGVVVSVSAVHVVVSGTDQFLSHVVQGEGRSFQNVRDLGLMVPDLLHLGLPLWVFCREAAQRRLRLVDLCHREEVILCLVFITLGTLLGRLL